MAFVCVFVLTSLPLGRGGGPSEAIRNTQGLLFCIFFVTLYEGAKLETENGRRRRTFSVSNFAPLFAYFSSVRRPLIIIIIIYIL